MKKSLFKVFLKRVPQPVKNVVKNFAYFFRKLKRKLLNKSVTVLFYPDLPRYHFYTIRKICFLLGYKMSNNPDKKHHLCVHWKDQTFRQPDEKLSHLMEKELVVNFKCNDISKRHVGLVFQEVFGYELLVDPLAYKGLCVVKSNINAMHDGRIIECPVEEVDRECVYQRFIDGHCNKHFVEDIRIPVFKERIPFVYLKYKPIESRFSFSVKGRTVADYGPILSQDEAGKVILFCQKIGLDYGELDAVRDRADGRLYIVDASNTPSMWFEGFSYQDRQSAFKLLAKTFEEVFLTE